MHLPEQSDNLVSVDPVTKELVWRGPRADEQAVDAAIARARSAQPSWRRQPLEKRAELLKAFAARVETTAEALAKQISRENGKPLWEARTEVKAVIGKIPISIQAHHTRCGEFEGGGSITRFRPHGVLAVLGPFNFPAHLPNGHIVPALLAGNTIVFKPSEHTPGVAEHLLRCWQEAGLPEGVLQVVHGEGQTGKLLAAHKGVDGVLFTGSERVGRQLLADNAMHPGKILALEMGGNNPLVVVENPDPTAAAVLVAQSAFLSSGQRCTCARRLILVNTRESERMLEALLRITEALQVGHYSEEPEPFMGPVISAAAAESILESQASLSVAGAIPLLESSLVREGTPLLRPGIVDVTPLANRSDEEIFGPLLKVIRVPDFEAAITEANNTRFGLAAGLIGGSAKMYESFRDNVRAGIVNWNRPLTGASSAAPFGGVGHSGNHRPSAYFAADYCSHPVASIENARLELSGDLPPGMSIRV